MIPRNILILNSNPVEAEFLASVCRTMGSVFMSFSLEEALSLLESKELDVVVVDSSLAGYQILRGLFKKTTSLVITGPAGKPVEEIIRAWPPGRLIEHTPVPPSSQETAAFLRKLATAIEHTQLKTGVERLQASLELSDTKLKEVYGEIKDLKNLISESIVKELEKRIAIEAKYIWFQKEQQKVEKILRKLYTANDVSTLLDIVYDTKSLVRASGISIYILEKSEMAGKYLKPLVWDDAFLTHQDFSKYIAPLDSEDIAAAVARYGHELNLSDLSGDQRLSKRYKERLRRYPQNILAVPIMLDQEVIGVLEVTNKLIKDEVNSEGFSAGDQQILSGLSEHIAIAMTKLNLIQYDALTGLLRPDPFFEKVLQKINAQSKRRREEGAYALVMGDVDWFKNFNDRNGHEAGNRLLRELAQVLKLSIREEDLLCRYGGEEFLFFLTGVKSMEEACLLTERIRKNVEEHYFEFQEYQPRQNLTMSFGVTLFPKNRIDAARSMSKNELKNLAGEADVAMAEAKGKKLSLLKTPGTEEQVQTKNKVCFYNHQLSESDQRALTIRPYKEKYLHERRKFERYYASTILIFKDEETYRVTRTINLSLGGAKIRSNNKLSPEKTLDLILVLDNQASPMKGDVVYSEPAEGDAPYYYSGLKFKDLTFAEREFLENYCLLVSKKNESSIC